MKVWDRAGIELATPGNNMQCVRLFSLKVVSRKNTYSLNQTNDTMHEFYTVPIKIVKV